LRLRLRRGKREYDDAEKTPDAAGNVVHACTPNEWNHCVPWIVCGSKAGS
jgi:hypothetical protein